VLASGPSAHPKNARDLTITTVLCLLLYPSLLWIIASLCCSDKIISLSNKYPPFRSLIERKAREDLTEKLGEHLMKCQNILLVDEG
jgi:hypothetical protein